MANSKQTLSIVWNLQWPQHQGVPQSRRISYTHPHLSRTVPERIFFLALMASPLCDASFFLASSSCHLEGAMASQVPCLFSLCSPSSCRHGSRAVHTLTPGTDGFVFHSGERLFWFALWVARAFSFSGRLRKLRCRKHFPPGPWLGILLCLELGCARRACHMLDVASYRFGP